MVDEMSAAVVGRGAMQVEVLQWCGRLMIRRERQGLMKEESRP